MRIYTRSGDKGTTSLVYGTRVAKNDPRVDAYGTSDEANSMIGLALSFLEGESFEGKKDFIAFMHRVQTVLFHVGAHLATPKEKEVFWKLKQEHIEELEHKIDEWDSTLTPLKNFILPTGHKASANLHVARTVVRRAERIATSIENGFPDEELVLAYLNRLSDLLFVAARYVNVKCGGEEIPLQTDV